jgi:Raf kinase inhibitor-like YbhB/YbcL family protein
MCVAVVAVAAILGCRGTQQPVSSPQAPPPQAAKEGKVMTTATMTAFKLTSSSFQNGKRIPLQFTGRGDNNSPELSWEGIPQGARELALIVEDSDAPGGDFVHWIVYNIPTSVASLSMGLPTETHPDEREPIMQGRNDSGRTGYFGPMPPPGKPHHYHFRLLALDKQMNLPPNVDKGKFREAIRGHVMAETDLTGTFES